MSSVSGTQQERARTYLLFRLRERRARSLASDSAKGFQRASPPHELVRAAVLRRPSPCAATVKPRESSSAEDLSRGDRDRRSRHRAPSLPLWGRSRGRAQRRRGWRCRPACSAAWVQTVHSDRRAAWPPGVSSWALPAARCREGPCWRWQGRCRFLTPKRHLLCRLFHL